MFYTGRLVALPPNEIDGYGRFAGPFGGTGGQLNTDDDGGGYGGFIPAFRIPNFNENGGAHELLGIYGRSGDLLDAIGFYYRWVAFP